MVKLSSTAQSELQFRLKKEAQEARKRIDLRNRLDEQGQRYGKVLDFRCLSLGLFLLSYQAKSTLSARNSNQIERGAHL